MTVKDISNALSPVICDELEDFYKYLQCDTFDIATRKIGDKYYDIFVDDIGTFVENPIVSAINNNDEVMLVGNLIIANHDAEGNTTSLTTEDVKNISKQILVATYKDGHQQAVLRCEY